MYTWKHSLGLYLPTLKCKARRKPRVLMEVQAHYHSLTGTNDSHNVVKFSINRLIINIDGGSINKAYTITFAICSLCIWNYPPVSSCLRLGVYKPKWNVVLFCLWVDFLFYFILFLMSPLLQMGLPKQGRMDFGFSQVASAILIIRPFRTPVFYRKKNNDNNSNTQTRKTNTSRFKEVG